MIPPAGIRPGKKDLFYNESHHAWREEVKKFVAKEIAPFVEEWEEVGEFPRELDKKAGDVGLLGMGYFSRNSYIRRACSRMWWCCCEFTLLQYIFTIDHGTWYRRTKAKIYTTRCCR